jgi:hypothetical protein
MANALAWQTGPCAIPQGSLEPGPGFHIFMAGDWRMIARGGMCGTCRVMFMQNLPA